MSSEQGFASPDEVAKLSSAPRRFPPANGWYGSTARNRSASIEESQDMADTAWTITSRIAAGLLLYTGLGWLLSLWIGHRPLLMAVGALVGLGLSFVLIFGGLSAENRRIAEEMKGKSSP